MSDDIKGLGEYKGPRDRIGRINNRLKKTVEKQSAGSMDRRGSLKKDWIDEINYEIRLQRKIYLLEQKSWMDKIKCQCGGHLSWEQVDTGQRDDKLYFHSACPSCNSRWGYCIPAPESVTGSFLTRGGVGGSNFDPLIGVCY